MSNLTYLFIEIKKQVDALAVISKRIYIDIISPLFMLHSPKIVYMFMSSLLQYFKDHGATVVASLDEGVVALEAQRSMEMIFDGVSVQFILVICNQESTLRKNLPQTGALDR